MTYTEDKRVWPLLLDLASCMCAEMKKAGLPGTCFCGVIPGEVVFDYCGENCESDDCGGMAWVSPRLIAPVLATGGFGTGPSVAPRQCQAPAMNVTFEAGVVRCAPMPDSSGKPPSLADQLEAARLQMADMAAVQRALLCCFTSPPTLEGWTSLGPDGGCIGGAWVASFPVD